MSWMITTVLPNELVMKFTTADSTTVRATTGPHTQSRALASAALLHDNQARQTEMRPARARGRDDITLPMERDAAFGASVLRKLSAIYDERIAVDFPDANVARGPGARIEAEARLVDGAVPASTAASGDTGE